MLPACAVRTLIAARYGFLVALSRGGLHLQEQLATDLRVRESVAGEPLERFGASAVAHQRP
jgi:hypothetical protein